MLASPREPARPVIAGASPEIGRRYLVDHPMEADIGFLRAVLRSAPSSGARRAGLVRADFAAGRVVVVDGWVLSHTEARLSALAFLLAA